MKNAFTIDLEEWFCTHNFHSVFSLEDWDGLESRVEQQTEKFLGLLQKNNTKATFFILGWVAERNPKLIKTIADEGHEIACHGYAHRLTWLHSPDTFRKDLMKAKRIIEEASSQSVTLFRAPAFSIVEKTEWALDILLSEGFTMSSSVFPTGMHPEYGMANKPLEPFIWANGLKEMPLSVLSILGKQMPISGGAYFRLFPYPIYKQLVTKLEKQSRALNFYIHPWEIDADIPRVKNVPLQRRLRHYTNLSKVEYKLQRLLSDFEFSTLSNTFKHFNNV